MNIKTRLKSDKRHTTGDYLVLQPNGQVKMLPRDLVLHWASVSHPQESNKLTLNWEEPYQVKEMLSPGAYWLEDLEGKSILRTFNI